MKKESKQEFSRRDFLKITRNAAIGAGVAGVLPSVIWLDHGIAAIPASEGYLLVDTKKCQGCTSCMLACSLAHEGVESLSKSRIQIIQDSFEDFPDDLTVEQCRQCVDPACVSVCPVQALTANAKHGNVRMVDEKKCIGCGACFEACPYTPARVVLTTREGGNKKSLKCDLCADTPYHWDDGGGGPNGKQACVEICPLSAIKFTSKIPKQKGEKGYKVNLRGRGWRRLGYSDD